MRKFQENVEVFKRSIAFCEGVSRLFCFLMFFFAWHSSQLPEQKEGLFNYRQWVEIYCYWWLFAVVVCVCSLALSCLYVCCVRVGFMVACLALITIRQTTALIKGMRSGAKMLYFIIFFISWVVIIVFIITFLRSWTV